jgi:hypothetical protein
MGFDRFGLVYGYALGSNGVGKLLVLGYIKETLTLALFLTLSAGQVAYFERKPQAAKLLLVATYILVVVTASSSFILAGLHSYL